MPRTYKNRGSRLRGGGGEKGENLEGIRVLETRGLSAEFRLVERMGWGRGGGEKRERVLTLAEGGARSNLARYGKTLTKQLGERLGGGSTKVFGSRTKIDSKGKVKQMED